MVRDNREWEKSIHGIATSALLALIVAWLASCSRTGIKLEAYREDDVQRTTTEQASSTTSSLRCLFTNCFKSEE